MNHVIRKAMTGIVVAMLFVISLGIGSALFTNNTYRFSGEYAGLGRETLLASFKSGRTKLQFYAYNIDEKLIISKQFFGYFLRFGSHYFIMATEQNTADEQQRLTTRSFFIRTYDDNAYMISDQRGVFITKEGKPLHLNSVLIGKKR